MCYPDQDYYIRFLFQRLKEFETTLTSKKTQRRGRPKVHADHSLIVFFAIMQLKGAYAFKAQRKWLLANPIWLRHLKLKSVPSRATLSRRYKQVASHLEAFVAYLGDFGVALDAQTPPQVVYEDKSLYKAKGNVWHEKQRQSGHIPEGLRALDTDASWSTSQYCGWVYGYGLHLTTTASGFPRLADVYTASVSEKAGLDEKTEALLARNIRYIVADAGYTDFNRVQALAESGLLLLTPIPGAKDPSKVAYLQAIETTPELRTYQEKRKTAIEPVFSLISELTRTDTNQKQLRVSRLDNVRTFLTLAVVLLQLAMIINSIYNLPSREVSWMIACFR